MSAPDQSTRILSELVQESETPARILKGQLQHRSELDAWFLHGGAAELGVVPEGRGGKQPFTHECVVARALWESHWREEVSRESKRGSEGERRGLQLRKSLVCRYF